MRRAASHASTLERVDTRRGRPPHHLPLEGTAEIKDHVAFWRGVEIQR